MTRFKRALDNLRFLPTRDDKYDEYVALNEISEKIKEAFADLKKDKADDPNRLNYTINAVEAIVDNRSQRTEQNLRAELTATRENMEAKINAMETKIDTLTKMLQTLIDKQP